MYCAFVESAAFTPDTSDVEMLHHLPLLVFWGIIVGHLAKNHAEMNEKSFGIWRLMISKLHSVLTFSFHARCGVCISTQSEGRGGMSKILLNAFDIVSGL
jgi:hypothetical protein